MSVQAPSVVLCVGGGIAAYKVASLLRLLTEGGARVRVVPTEAALRFVGEPTWAALSGQAVAAGLWDDVHEVPHVALGRHADLVVVAPATADVMARAAAGMAGDLLGAVLLTARCPVLMAPAMHTEMWDHPATVANVATLRARGIHVLDPASGRLTGADTGQGRLPEPAEIHAAALALLDAGAPAPGAASSAPEPSGDLAGRRVVVSAGGTREPVDPVRFLGNASTGRQGAALAAAARDRGARVVLVAAHVEVDLPDGVQVVRVSTAAELGEAVARAATGADAVVMAAAVADFRPVAPATSKVKKDEGDGAPTLVLERTPDVLAALVAARRDGTVPAGTVLVGFAAETGDENGSVLDHGRAKLLRKGCDAIVVNAVGGGRGFGDVETTATLLERVGPPDAAGDGGEGAGDGASVVERAVVGPGPKADVAAAVWDLVVDRLAGAPGGSG